MTQHEHWECPPVLTTDLYYDFRWWYQDGPEEWGCADYWYNKYQPIEDEL